MTRGSGTYAGIATLARALQALGVDIRWCVPPWPIPVFTLRRLLFNELLRHRPPRDCDAVVGFDMDGYRIAGQSAAPHVASIKGVIADEMRYERGLTRATMALQARCEAKHVQRAQLVVTTSRYAASRVAELYRLAKPPVIVPELIDLSAWRECFRRNPPPEEQGGFTVLTVCRFYPRKRLDVLLRAAALLRPRIPDLQIRVVGGGPQASKLRRLWRKLELEATVLWLGDVSQGDLAREYQRADVFCLPSVQEGFGIVFLEAMAAGKPIVAARAAAAPEVVRHGLLVAPDSAEELAEAILRLYYDRDLARALGGEGQRAVLEYDAPRVARRFLEALRQVL